MAKIIRRIAIVILSAVFIFSVGSILFIQLRYRADDKLYTSAAEQYVRPAIGSSDADTGTDTVVTEPDGNTPPVDVDFEALQKENEDIIGWIYCEGTAINYPVLQGSDNDFYLHHAYDKSYCISGAVFIDCGSKPDFSDPNTIIYGHYMKNKTMFGGLSDWADQEFYDNHSEMWLFTPEKDYKIVLFSGYTTSALSDSYLHFDAPGAAFNDYLKDAAAASDFKSDALLFEDSSYVMMSTCAYVFDNARYVLHGMLVPVN